MSKSLEITGKILSIGQVQQITEKFSKRMMCVQTKEGQYPEFVALQFVNDRTDLPDNYAVGQEVRCHFNLKSREYNSNYFTECTCWALTLASNTPSDYSNVAKDANSAPVANGNKPAPVPEQVPQNAPKDDLPF